MLSLSYVCIYIYTPCTPSSLPHAAYHWCRVWSALAHLPACLLQLLRPHLRCNCLHTPNRAPPIQNVHTGMPCLHLRKQHCKGQHVPAWAALSALQSLSPSLALHPISLLSVWEHVLLATASILPPMSSDVISNPNPIFDPMMPIHLRLSSRNFTVHVGPALGVGPRKRTCSLFTREVSSSVWESHLLHAHIHTFAHWQTKQRRKDFLGKVFFGQAAGHRGPILVRGAEREGWSSRVGRHYTVDSPRTLTDAEGPCKADASWHALAGAQEICMGLAYRGAGTRELWTHQKMEHRTNRSSHRYARAHEWLRKDL